MGKHVMFPGPDPDCHACSITEIGLDMARNTMARQADSIGELRKAIGELLRTHDGWHEEDCRAFGAGSDADLPLEPFDPDPQCTCGRTEVRNQARAVVSSATAFAGTEKKT